jgi:hypothetical protein
MWPNPPQQFDTVQEMLRFGCISLISDLSATGPVEGVLYPIVPPDFVPSHLRLCGPSNERSAGESRSEAVLAWCQ